MKNISVISLHSTKALKLLCIKLIQKTQKILKHILLLYIQILYNVIDRMILIIHKMIFH